MARPRDAKTLVQIVCGPARSERQARVLEHLRSHWGSALLLVPSRRLATRRLEDLLLRFDLPGTWGRPIDTFQGFAARLLREEGVNTTLLNEFERRTILERALEKVRVQGGLDAVEAASRTPGFVTHMLRVITQLKQAALEPGEFRMRAAQRAPGHWLDPVVAAVYEAYQTDLIGSGRYDLVGLYWKAETVCNESRPSEFDSVRHLVLDGFDDFTPSEFRLLRAVAPHLESLTFSMSCTMEDGSQDDLYALPRDTVHKLESTFRAKWVESPERVPERLSDYVAKHLFWRDIPGPAPPGADDVTLSVYVNPAHEVEEVGRAIKRLIVDGHVPPCEIAVLYRDLNEHADTVRTVFEEMNIPAAIDLPPSLDRSALGRFLTALLELAPEWRRDEVLDVLTSPWFAPGHGAIRSYHDFFPALARLAQIVEGESEWVRKVARLPAVLESNHRRDVARMREQGIPLDEAVSALNEAVELLREAVSAIAAARDDAAFVGAMRSALDTLQTVDAIDGLAHSEWRSSETAASRALDNVLATIHHWSADGADTSAVRFRQAMSMTSYSIEQPRDGVQVLQVESARHLTFRHVFFCGLVEGAVPKPPSASAIYTDNDVTELEKAGVLLESRRGRNARERLLFHHALSLHRETLHLSWHARSREDKETGPSPFVADVRELGGDNIPSRDLRTRVVPALESAASPRDLKNASASVSYDISGFDDFLEPVGCAAAIERRRYRGEPFDAFDGRLTADALLDGLARKFGAAHRFSARQLETYAECPFRFFAQEIFGLEPPEEPAPELDARLRGIVMHDALQRFHVRFQGRTIASLNPSDAEEAMRDAVAEAFETAFRRDQATPRGVLRAEQARLTRQLLRYLDIERNRDDGWLPEHFEVSFGRDLSDHPDTWSTETPFKLDTAAGTVLVAGIVDRIDERGNTYRIVDYKNSIGRHTAAAINDGVDLQLLLYTQVLESMLHSGAVCESAQYLQVGRDQRREVLDKEEAERRAALPERVNHYVQGMRTGHFEPTPYNEVCNYCATRRVCRYETGRIDRKEAAS